MYQKYNSKGIAEESEQRPQKFQKFFSDSNISMSEGIANRSEQRPQEPRHRLGMPWLAPWLVWGCHAIGRTDW